MNAVSNYKKLLLARLIAAAVIATVASPVVSYAQSADANLRGMAAPSSTITATNTATGYTRVTKAGADGTYALVSLPPGTYKVDAGPGTEQTVTLTVASTATLNLAAKAAPTGNAVSAQNLGAVTVNANTLTEVTTSEVGNTVSQRQIATVPQITRNFLEFADTVPGMVFTVQQNGQASLQSGGQAPTAINVYIDGVGQKNYVLPGGITGQSNSQGNPFPQLAIGEYKVITSNYKAEYDQISSAAVTAETKSGTNEFHGELFGDWTDTWMRAETPSEIAADKKTPSHDKEYGFSFGGPIIQDKAHFFIAYEGKEYDTPITVVPGSVNQQAQVVAQLPPSALAQLGPTGLPFKEDLYFAKLDWEPSNRDRIEFSGKYRDESAISGPGTGQAASTAVNVVNYDRRFDIRWDHSSDSWFNRLQATYENAFYKPTPVQFGNGYVYTTIPSENQQTILDVGPATPLAGQDKGQKGPSISDDLTFNDFEWHGDHVIKMGVSYKVVTLTAQDAFNYNPQFYYYVTPAGTEPDPYQVVFPSQLPGTNPMVRTSDRQLGTYIQDDWTVDDHLTLNLGLRWDYEWTPSYLNWVTPQAVINALNAPNPWPGAAPGQTYAQSLALGGVNVGNYISTGNNRHPQDNQFMPRFGFSYDINGDQAHVIHGGAGRSYDRNLYELLQLEQTKIALGQPTLGFETPYSTCNPGPTCIPWNPAYYGGLSVLQGLLAASSTGREVDMVTNNLKTPYSDQVSLGMRNQIGEWNTDVTVARVNSFNGLVYQLGNRYPNGAFWENGSQPWGDGIPGWGNLIIANNGLETKTTQLLISAEKPYTPESHWGVTIAYTYSHALQNNDSQDVTDQYAFDEETIGDYPFIGSAVARHRLVSTASLDGPWGLLFGAKLTLSTPIPGLGLACFNDTSTPSGCLPYSATPPGSHFLIGGPIWGYRSIDFQVTKNFKIYGNFDGYVRMDLLNAFNWNNYSDYNTNYGANGVLNSTPVTYNTIGNILGTPREVKVTLGIKF
ncbi:TonB-dependent receptor [Dyella dinghuensis]|uniref:TonB-dependent receptor n=1 Tax=Dyella dinghuensis TaxID=1920169 RepID=A0A432LR57_9GAMM|nr:TonB-dependent receptor [Dyella dinghuensis]RUL63029.1 TonB-dependent receptor [Dyella dinghuensis]